MNPAVFPNPGSRGDVAGFRRVNARQDADAFTVFRVLAGGDVDAVFPEHRRGVDFTHAFGGGIFDGLAVLVLLVFGRIGVVFPNVLRNGPSAVSTGFASNE